MPVFRLPRFSGDNEHFVRNGQLSVNPNDTDTFMFFVTMKSTDLFTEQNRLEIGQKIKSILVNVQAIDAGAFVSVNSGSLDATELDKMINASLFMHLMNAVFGIDEEMGIPANPDGVNDLPPGVIGRVVVVSGKRLHDDDAVTDTAINRAMTAIAGLPEILNATVDFTEMKSGVS